MRPDTGPAAAESAAKDAAPATPWALRGIYIALGLSTASLAPFVPVILKGRGLDPASIGVVAALAALSTTVIVPAWGHLADEMVGRVRAFRIGAAVAAAFAVGLLLDLPIMVIAAMLASFSVFASLFLGLTDALAMATLPAPERQYGPLRSHASLSFALGVTAAGVVYGWAGYAAAPFVFLIWAIGLFLLVGRVPDGTTKPRAKHSAEDARRAPVRVRAIRLGSPGRALSVQPRLGILLVVSAVAYAGLQGGGTFVGVRIVDLHGQPSDVALSFGISALTEIPGLFAVGWLGQRLGLRRLLVGSMILYGLCVASWGVLPSAPAINATRIVTGLCNGWLMATRVLLVSRLLPPSLQATGQVLFQAAALGAGSVVGSVVGGFVYGSFGPVVFFAGAGAVAIAGAAGSWFVLAGPIGDRFSGRYADPLRGVDGSAD